MLVPPATLGVPSPKFHENVYGAVSPDAVAVKLTGVPTVPVVGAVVKLSTSGVPVILMDDEVNASFPLVSVTLTLTMNVPLVLYVWVWVFGFVAPPATLPEPSPKFQLNE